MLVAYSLYGRLQRGQEINYLKELASRYVRVMPPVVALMMFGTFVLPILGSGPIYPMLINEQSELCKKTYWRSLLLIQNWFGFENICMTHTHHVGTDFELFIFAPFLIMMLYKFPRNTKVVIIILSLLSTFARFYTVYVKNLSSYILHNVE
jgi:peptidoglycan/LPS O-acetylase OafA/YrhL